jgi:hypothetical protein
MAMAWLLLLLNLNLRAVCCMKHTDVGRQRQWHGMVAAAKPERRLLVSAGRHRGSSTGTSESSGGHLKVCCMKHSDADTRFPSRVAIVVLFSQPIEWGSLHQCHTCVTLCHTTAVLPPVRDPDLAASLLRGSFIVVLVPPYVMEGDVSVARQLRLPNLLRVTSSYSRPCCAARVYKFV